MLNSPTGVSHLDQFHWITFSNCLWYNTVGRIPANPHPRISHNTKRFLESQLTDGSPGDVWELWSRLRFLRPIRDGPRVLLESLSGLFARACTAARGPVVILVTNSDSFSLSSSFLFSSVLFLRSNPSGYQYLCRFAFVGAPSRGTIAKKIAIPSSTSLVHQCANLLREFISFELKCWQNGLLCPYLYKSVWKIPNSTNFPNFIPPPLYPLTNTRNQKSQSINNQTG